MATADVAVSDVRPADSTPSAAGPGVFVVFVLSVLLAMATAMYVATYILVTNAVDRVQRDYATQVTQRATHDLERLVSTHLASLGDQAALPAMINSVMNPGYDRAALSDFMEDLLFLGEKGPLALLDINGSVIGARGFQPDRADQFGAAAWVTALIEGDARAYAEIVAGSRPSNLWMRYGVPVRYNGFPEGVLVAELPLQPGMLLHRDSEGSDSVSLEIFGRGQRLALIGPTPDANYVGVELEIEHLATPMRLHLDDHGLDRVLFKLFAVIMLVTLGIGGAFLILFRKIGLQLFVRPRMMLEQAQRDTLIANRRLSYANEELSQFAYRTSHDLKGPLTTIEGLSRYAIKDLQSGDYAEVRSNVAKIGAQAGKLSKLVADILELSRADLLDVERDSVDIALVYEHAIRSVGNQIGVQDTTLTSDIRLSRPFTSQGTRIAQILENLISNGVKYADPDRAERRVSFSAWDDDASVTLCIEDNGLGIPLSCQPDVFAMFKRFHPKVATGSGLGLSIVKKHFDRLGGDIRFTTSESGTRFTIVLPRHAAA